MGLKTTHLDNKRAFFQLITFLFLSVSANFASAALILTGAVNPDPVAPGSKAYVEFEVANNGNAQEAGLSLEIDVPTGIDLFAVTTAQPSGGQCLPSVVGTAAQCGNGEKLTWNIGALNGGDSYSYRFPVTISSATAVGTTVSFIAHLLNSGPEVTTTASTIVEAAPVLAMTIDADKDPVAQGESLIYSLRYGNQSAGTASISSKLIMPIPSGTSFVSATGGANYDSTGKTVTWSWASLGVGDAGSVELKVAVDAGLANGDIIEAKPVLSDSLGNTQRAGIGTRVYSGGRGLELTIAANPDPVRPGEFFNVFYTISNPTATDRFNVTLQALVPTGLDLFAVTAAQPNNGQCVPNIVGTAAQCGATEWLTWNIAGIAAGESVTVMMPATVATSTPNGSVIPFITRLVEGTNLLMRNGHSVVVKDNTVLNLMVDANKDPVEPNANLVYSLSYGNQSIGVAAIGSQLSMPIPSGTSFVKASQGATYDDVNKTVSWSWASLGAGEGGKVELTVAVDAAAVNGFVIEARPTIKDTLGNEQRAALNTRVNDSARALEVTIAPNPQPVEQGEFFHVMYTISNHGSVDRFNVTLEALVPSNLNLFAVSAAQPNNAQCVPNLVGTAGQCGEREWITWNFTSIAAGASVTVLMPATVATAPTNGSVIPFITRLTDGAGLLEWEGQSVLLQHGRALTLIVDADKDPVAAGDTLNYSLSLGNLGASTSTNTVVTLPLAQAISFVSANAGGIYDNATHSVSWTIAALNPGEVAKLQLQATVDSAVAEGSVLVAAASVTNNNGDDVRASLATRVNSGEVLSASMTQNPVAIQPGQPADVGISITNSGGTDLFNIKLELLIPSGFNLFSNTVAQPTGATCLPSLVGTAAQCGKSEWLTWDMGTVLAGQTVVANVTPTLANTTVSGSVIPFIARVTDGTGRLITASQALLVGNLLQVTNNQNPQAMDDSFETTKNTAFVTGNVLNNDSDADGDSLSITAIDTSNTQGTVINNNDGTFNYTPASDFIGNDSFAYTISDGNGGTAMATVSITVKDNVPSSTPNSGGSSGGGGGSLNLMLLALLILTRGVRKKLT